MTALFFAFKTQGRERIFWLAITPIWLIMVARELNWGAVFYPPTGFSEEEGPMYASAKLWYHPYRTPIVAIVIAAQVVGFTFSRSWRVVPGIMAQWKFPFFDIACFVVAMLISTASEQHIDLSMAWWPGYGEMVEETMELAAYIFLLSAQYRVWLTLRNSPRFQTAFETA